jgi:hypothetical protein
MEVSASGTSLAQCSARKPTGPGARWRYFNVSSELRRDGPRTAGHDRIPDTQFTFPKQHHRSRWRTPHSAAVRLNHVGRVAEGRREAWKLTEAIAPRCLEWSWKSRSKTSPRSEAQQPEPHFSASRVLS